MRDISASAYDIDVPEDATSIGTRCCGATSVHFVDCRERLDIADPASYRGKPDELVEPDDLRCDNCSRQVREGEYRDVELANDAGGMRICDDCWERVP